MSLPERIGRYRVTHLLGEGGMGMVYAAHDDRLDREVAIKVVRPGSDTQSRERMWVEARSAAGASHPNICQLFEIGEEGDDLFIAMELLQGEALGARIGRGPVPENEAAQITLGVLAGLGSLHRRGFIHRDLKPSNVFLTEHGVKLLDFGLARRIPGTEGNPAMDTSNPLTQVGMVMGTPHYIAPEQLLDRPVDARSDLFAVGAILYEMLTGERAFKGNNPMEVFHAVLTVEPSALAGSAQIAALDRIIHRAMAKEPDRRPDSAEVMADEVRAAMMATDSDAHAQPARPRRRLIVLPFRVLRPDPETDFLAIGLADATASSLAGLESLVVRSSLTAQQLARETDDLKVIARRADVDLVLTGTLLRAGEQIRVGTQLVDARTGELTWSDTTQVPLGDLFQLQDALTRRIVESLALPLSARENTMLRRDVPATAKAYEFYLRANDLGYQSGQWGIARDLYLRCLDEDPRFAPAWARLGRIYRTLAINNPQQADENYAKAREAFDKALEINPELPVAHNLYTYLEVEMGRAKEAMVRLLERARGRAPDPELYAGLVQACRYAGLSEASVAAHDEAVRLDHGIRTSVAHAHFMLGDYQRALEAGAHEPAPVRAMFLLMLDRTEEAVEIISKDAQGGSGPVARAMATSSLAMLDGDNERSGRELTAMMDMWKPRDPCGMYYMARQFAKIRHAQALPLLRSSVERGHYVFKALARDPWLDGLRGNAEFRHILRLAEERYRDARAAFLTAGGDRLLELELV